MIFIDAGAFIARHRKSDDHHAAALEGWRQIERKRTPCATSSLVLVEAATFLCRAAGNAMAAERMRIWLSSDQLLVLRPDREIELEAADLLDRYADQKIGFADCVSFILMGRRRIDTVFGFDRHFRVAGFSVWPPEKGS
jgi:predicted nucleic acid-binding protein